MSPTSTPGCSTPLSFEFLGKGFKVSVGADKFIWREDQFFRMEKERFQGMKNNGKTFILAYDHGMEHGPSDFKGLPETADPERVFKLSTFEDVNILAVQKGLAETYYDSYSDKVNLLVKLNGTPSMKKDVPYSPKNCTVKRAVEIGADAVGYTVYPGSIAEEKMFEDFREVQENAREHGIPVVMWAYPRGNEIDDDTTPEVVSYGARIGLELGADMVKVKYTGSRKNMEEVTRVTGDMDVVVSGGSRKEDKEFLEMLDKSLEAGCVGTAVGRNVWKRKDPEKIIKAIGDLLFRDKTVEEAIENF